MKILYTGDMTFAKALPAPKPRSATAVKIAWLYAAALVVMAVGQLFSFEDFTPLMQEYQLPGGIGTATLAAGLIVVTEVFALPFLLRMRLSLLMRWVSLSCGLAAAAIWFSLATWAYAADTTITNSGILGTEVVVPAGSTQLIASLCLVVLAAWSAWGLWPAVKRKNLSSESGAV